MKNHSVKLVLPLLVLLFSQFNAFAQTPSKIYVLFDSSGSMKRSYDWLSNVLPAITEPLSEQPKLRDNIDFITFTNSSKLQVSGNTEDILEFAKGMDFGGGFEDGLLALDTLLKKGKAQNAHVILLTDEDRSQAKPLDLLDFNNTLSSKKITLHVFMLHRALTDLTVNGFQYYHAQNGDKIGVSLDKISIPKQTSDEDELFDNLFANRELPPEMKARVARKQVAHNDDYIKVALKSGGYVWGLPGGVKNKSDWATQSPVIGQLMAAKFFNRKASWPSAKVQVIGDGISQVHAVGGLVTFDASDIGEHPVESWEWDFDGDDNIDDVGPSVYTQFKTPGKHKVKLWLSDGKQRQLQIVVVEVQ